MRTLPFPGPIIISRRFAAALLLLLMAACAACAAALAPDDRDAIARNGFHAGDVGYTLFDLDSGAVLAERQPDKPFIPASVAKLPAMAAALAILGPEHRFDTALHATGTLRGGVLEGDLILKGGGDPSLATEGLLELVAELRAMGVQRVAGRFLFDATALPELPEIDSGQPWTAGYNTGVGALSLNFNRAQIVWTRTPTGGVAVTAWSVSDAGRHPLDSVTVEVARGGPTPFTPQPYRTGERWLFAPAAGPGAEGRVWLPVGQPALAAATIFRRVAGEAGIALPAPAAGPLPPAATLLALHRSEPLAVLARQVLRYSNNLSAELIGLSAARRLDPAVATLARSAAVLGAWSAAHAPRADWGGFHLANHSGLSAASRMTPRQMAALLRGAGPAVLDLLPGEDEGKNLPGGVRAKSGTLAYAKALAGTLTTAGGRRLGFAFFVTDAAGRAALDAAMDRRIADMPAEARAWLVRARALQADLLALWVSHF